MTSIVKYNPDVLLHKEVYLGAADLEMPCPRCGHVCHLESLYNPTAGVPQCAVLWCSKCDDDEQDDTFFKVGTVTVALQVTYEISDTHEWQGN